MRIRLLEMLSASLVSCSVAVAVARAPLEGVPGPIAGPASPRWMLDDGAGPPSVERLASGRSELLVAVTFLDARTGFAVGGNSESGTPAILLRTEDGARQWMAIDTGLKSRLYAIHFPTDRVGYAAGLHGAVLKTEDRGRTWRVMPAPGDVWLASIFFTSPTVGFAAGGDQDGPLLIETVDGGTSWQSLVDRLPKAGRPRTLRCVKFRNGQSGFAVGESGGILVTNDAGRSWTAPMSGADTWLRAITVVDDRHVFVGGTGAVLHSADGGATWARLPSPGNEKINDLAFVDVNVGYASTMDGRLWWTGDAGQHWQRLVDNGGRALCGLALVSTSLAYVVGDGGTVIVLRGSPPSPVRQFARSRVRTIVRFSFSWSPPGGNGL